MLALLKQWKLRIFQTLMNSHHHHHHGCHHPHITTTTSLPCSYMYVLCYRQDQSNKFNLESPFV